MNETDIKDKFDEIKNIVNKLYDRLHDTNICMYSLYESYRNLEEWIDKTEAYMRKENK